MGLLQVFRDKTATVLKSTAIVSYLVQSLPLNRSAVYQWWLVEDGLRLVGFL